MSNPPTSPGFVDFQVLTAEELNQAFVAKQDYPAVTPSVGDNSTLVATTAFVNAALANELDALPSDAPPFMDTGTTGLPGSATTYSRADHVHPSDTTLAPLAGAVFTGPVRAPTPPTSPPDNSTLVATTAFVAAAAGTGGSNTPPPMDSGTTGSAGSVTLWSRGDHYHPSDTSRAPLAGPAAFTGVLTSSQTLASTDNSTNVATTAFVKSAIAAGGGAATPYPNPPAMDAGTVGSPGSDSRYSMGDHVHPSDSTKVTDAPATGGPYGRQAGNWVSVASSGTGVSVASLTGGLPLVGDGMTDNFNSWVNVPKNMYNLNNEWPVTVTLSSLGGAGSPCVVTWLDPVRGKASAHNLKPNQAFYFLPPSGGGSLPGGITANTPYFVTLANMTLNSFTFSTVNNTAAYGLGNVRATEGNPVTTTSAITPARTVFTFTFPAAASTPSAALLTAPLPALPNGTPVMLNTTGTAMPNPQLPSPFVNYNVYYVVNSTAGTSNWTFSLASTVGGAGIATTTAPYVTTGFPAVQPIVNNFSFIATVVLLITFPAVGQSTITCNQLPALPNGTPVTLSSGNTNSYYTSLPLPLPATAVFYIVNSTTSPTSWSFGLASVPNGTAIVLTGTAVSSYAYFMYPNTVQVVLTSKDWINLLVPPGTYATHYPFGYAANRFQSNFIPMGVSKVRVNMYGAVFDDLTVPAPSGAMLGEVPLPGSWAIQHFDYIKTTQQRGANPTIQPIQLMVPSNASYYYPGGWITILSMDMMNDLGKLTSGPPCNHYVEFNQIVSIDATNGYILLKYPPRFVYSDRFPNMYNGNQIGGGAAVIAPMGPQWDVEYEILGGRFPIAMPGMMGRRVIATDCKFDIMFGMATLSREVIFRHCEVTGNLNQVDKMMEYLEFEDCKIALPFTNSTCLLCVIKKCRGTLSGLPRSMHIEDSIIDSWNIGLTDLGVADMCTIRNSRVEYFTWTGRDDGAGYGYGNYGNAILANWTFSNGTFSRDLTKVPQANSLQPWAVPGGKYFLSDEARQFTNMGSPFAVLNVYMTGTAIFAPAVAAYGAGGTHNAPVVLTLVGGTLNTGGTAATINGTIGPNGGLLYAGALSVANGGNYSTFPLSPAQVTSSDPGLTGVLVSFAGGGIYNVDTTLRAIPTIQGTVAGITAAVSAGPTVFSGAVIANSTPVLLQSPSGVLPTGFTPITTVYYVVQSSSAGSGSFQLAATSTAVAGIVGTGTPSGTYTVITNPLHINPHPCPRFTASGNSGWQDIVDLNGAVDEPIWSRFKRSFVGFQSTQEINFQYPVGTLWGNLVSMTINVIQPAVITSGTCLVSIGANGFTQPNLGTSGFAQTVNLTIAGVRTITPTTTTGAQTGDILVPYGDWLSCGILHPLSILPAGTPTTNLANCAIWTIEVLTDQGITKYATMFGAGTQVQSNTTSTYVDSSIKQIWPAVP